ncbi:MAG: DegT/DnrJ/EryC1/StrS family aminotransferase [Thermodesulfobacteriota bacterium]
MEVKYLDLPPQFADPQLLQEIAGLLKDCRFILGPAVARFEEKFAQICGARFAVGVNSGTDALFLGLKALNIGPGHEVITVANSFVATAGAIVAAGAQPMFVDVGPDYNMDPDLIEAALTPRTRALIPVHLTGNPADMPRLLEIARKHRLFVLEDAAQAVGAAIGGKPVGSFGELGCFSLHPLKNLNAAGDGGVITTNDEELYWRLQRLHNHGLKNRDEIEFFGYNSRLDSLQALIAAHRLQQLDEVTRKRLDHARRYDGLLLGLADDVVLPPRRPGVRQVFHTYVVQVRDRERLMSFLAEHGIETKVHYPVPIHLQEPCRRLGWRPGDLPETERQSQRILSLPVHQDLTEAQILHVAETIRQFYRRR